MSVCSVVDCKHPAVRSGYDGLCRPCRDGREKGVRPGPTMDEVVIWQTKLDQGWTLSQVSTATGRPIDMIVRLALGPPIVRTAAA